MSNQLTIIDKVSDPLVYAEKVGFAMAQSGMFGLKNAEAGMVVALTCLAEGITPMEFGRTYHIVLGKPSMRSDAMLAEFRKRGGKHKVVRRDEDGACVELTDRDGNSQPFSLTWEEAQREDFTVDKDGEIKDNYKYPRKRMQMLWARVISDGVRTLCPEIVSGIYTPEETADFMDAEPARVAAPAKVVEALPAVTVSDAVTVTTAHPANGKANLMQVAFLEEQCEQLQLPLASINAMLEKRGVKQFEDLTQEQADEITEKLAAKIAEKR